MKLNLLRTFLMSTGLSAGVFLVSCASLETNAPPVSTMSTPTSAYAHLNSGIEIYIGKCAKCHAVEPIRSYSMADWNQDILPSMVKKTKLNSAEEASLTAYVHAVLRSPVAAQP